MPNVPQLAQSRRLRKTPFTSRVMQQGVVAFTVYNHMLLPTEFDGFAEDYWHLSRAVQVWDVSAQRQVSIRGRDATRLVQLMTPREVPRVALDRCVYLPLADEHGRLVNDPVGIRLAEDHWWLSIADSDVLLWASGLARGAGLDVQVQEPDVWPLAIQGPLAEDLMARVFGEEVRAIRFFRYARLSYHGHAFIVARSGWSKQGGFEVYVDHVELGQRLYDELFEQGVDLDVRPGCPNIIERLENGLLAYGNDMDSRHSVLESGLENFIDLDADIDSLSVQALRAERERGLARRLMGLMIDAPDGARTLAENPFITGAEPDRLPLPLPEAITQQSRITHCLGSQVWSPRYRQQIATAVIDEPLASESDTTLRLADGTVSRAKICTLPFDFAGEGVTGVV
ncbi:MAG: dimethylsulfoniopropionate demethylase [Granulosicoccus sp.]|nr:dimethylsulfoniopropionate demethylase [Granulosicoccus sp.]